MTAAIKRVKFRNLRNLLRARCEAATSYWPSFHSTEADSESNEAEAPQADTSGAIRRQSTGRAPTLQMPDLTVFLDEVRGRARLAAVVGRIPYLRAIASELFLGEIGFEIEEDPEISGRLCVTVSVEITADLEEVAKRRREWYNHVTGLLGQDCELVQLIVNVND